MGCCNKFALFVINFFVFGVGIAVVVVASLVISKDNTYGVLLGTGTFSLPIVVLIAGLIILVIGFLGCCGALKENSCMLQTYAGIVLVLLIAEIVLGIMILVNTDKAEESVQKEMQNIFNGYGKKDEALTKSLDHVQHDLKCCGTMNYTDWEETDYGKANPKSVADGCCIDFKPECGQNILSKPAFETLIYTDGCYPVIREDIHGLAIWMGVICIVLAIVQLLSISCACGIAKKSKAYA